MNEVEFEEVYKKNYMLVLKFLVKLCGDVNIAEEIAQDSFYKALINIDKFKGDCKVSVWLCQIAKNDYLTYIKKQKLSNSTYDENKLIEKDFVKNIIDKEQTLEIYSVIHKLKEPYKDIMIFRLYCDLSFSEIAKIVGKTESYARLIYYRGKKIIMEEMNEKGM